MSIAREGSGRLRILAALLAMPEEDSRDVLRDMLQQAPWLEPALSELRETTLEHWQAEHTRLFISGFPKTPCPPYESAYRQGSMGGTSAADLRDLYRRAGLQALDAPADYLGTMLECAAYLQDRGMAVLLDELAEGHMRQWVPRFAGDLQRQAGLRLYRELGRQIEGLFPGGSGP